MKFLIDVGAASLAKLAELTVQPVIRQVGYVIYYNKYMEELDAKIDGLLNAKEMMQHYIKEEERNGKIIVEGNINWLIDVEQLNREAAKVKSKHLAQTKCLKGICPNPKLRYRLSRKSMELVREVAALQKTMRNINDIPDCEVFDSRASIANDVIDELRKSETYMIGVYGIAGVGKTTLVKQVYKQVTAGSDQKLFDETIMVLDVKKNPSIERIQKLIAKKLGLELLDSGTQEDKARRISNRIKEKKTLVILDDIWEFIDLEDVGLPHMATLKILLTSRSKDVLAEEMGTQKNFDIKKLSKQESWRLFKQLAGGIVEKADIHSRAIEVAAKCDGLPLLIATVAISLKGSPLYVWDDTFRRLKRFDDNLINKIYSGIEWSYHKLQSDELKSIFLLCASEVGSANGVNILDLLKYSIGLGFIKDINTMEDARDLLHTILRKLQHSCLLDTYDNQRVRIHDLVISAAKRIMKDPVLLVSAGSVLEEWPNQESCKNCTRISLTDCTIPELPQVLECPELTLFHISRVHDQSLEIPSDFFKEMTKLKVLDLTRWSIPSLPPSLKCLKDLQTLCLDYCTLGDISFVGVLHTLKVLSLLYSKVTELPKEIGNLTCLQLLDLTGCSELEVISPEVISKLIRLEELRMGKNSFNKWQDGRVSDANRSNASLEELMCLSRLTTLHIHVPDVTILPANLFTTNKLERFQICIGSVWKWEEVDEALNTLKLEMISSTNKLDYGLQMLLKRTQDLYVEGMESVIYDKLFHVLATTSNNQLKHLHVQNNANFTYTVNEQVVFLNLTWLAVSELNSVRFLLSSSMARSLSQLKRLQVSKCQMMEEVILMEESKEEIVTNFFPQLEDLELNNLPNLTRFCSTSFPSWGRSQLQDCIESGGVCEEVAETALTRRKLDSSIEHFLLENKVELGKLTRLTVKGLTKLTSLWSTEIHNTSAVSFDCENLEYVEIDSCENLQNIFPVWVARNLRQLQTLKVKNSGVKQIVAARNDGSEGIIEFVFPKVTRVIFVYLPNLVNFCPGMHSSSWPLLNNLQVLRCDKVDLFAEEISSFQQTRETKSDGSVNNDRGSLFCFDQGSFPNLFNLASKATEFPNGRSLAEAQLSSKLGELVVNCPESKSLDFLLKSTPITDPQGGNNYVEVRARQWPQLIQLELNTMEKLMHLGPDDEDDNSQSEITHIPNIPNLQVLLVEGCPCLKNLRTSAISFNNLTKLQVYSCNRLKYLINYSMAISLIHLTRLDVQECLRLEQIVGSNDEFDDNDSRNEITLPKLKSLKLSGLHRLQSFCSGNCIIKLPSLKTLKMSNRLKFKIFATGSHEQLQLITHEQEDDTDVEECEVSETIAKKSSGGSHDRDVALANLEKEKSMSFVKAWEESEKNKAENKAEKKLSTVTAGENTKKAAIEAKLRSREEKLEKKKAQYAEKMKNQIAALHKEADEKRALVQAERGQELLKAEEMAAKYRAIGGVPKKCLGCF